MGAYLCHEQALDIALLGKAALKVAAWIFLDIQNILQMFR